MKFKHLLTKSLLAAVCLLAGQSAWAVDVPTPVYFNDFSSTEGLTIQGSGEFVDDADANFGKIYQNDPQNNNSVRTNYLVLPSDVLSHSATSKEMTIGFWVNQKKEETNYLYYPLFAAYAGAPNQTSNENGMPMFVCQSRGLLQYNNESEGGTGSWCNFEAAQNVAGSNSENNSWCFDGKWHYYTVTLTETSAKVYVDGTVVNSWTLDNSTDGQKMTAFLTNTKLTYVTLGGNQAWSWGDPDPAFGFDDFAVYDQALSSEQIEQIIDTKLGRTTLLEYGTSDAPWTTDRMAEWSGKALTLGNSVVEYAGKDNSDFSTYKTISPIANAIINVTAVWRARSNTGRYWANNCGIYFRFGNIVVAQNDQDKQHGYTFGGLSSISSSTTFTAGSYRADIASCTWLKIEAEINTATNTLTSFSIKSEDGTTTYVNVSDVALIDPDYTTVAIGFQRGGSHNTEKQEQLKSIKITQTPQAVTNVNYTINYKLGENLVKSVSDEGVVGQEITADVAIDGTETGYEKHYLITAESAPSMTLDAETANNVLEVPVRAPYTATLKVTTTVGGNTPVLVETPLTETDAKVRTWSYAYPMYVLDGGKYYIADNTTTFGEGGEFANGQVIERSVTYSTVDESVVFFSDAEASAGTNYSYSNGGSGYVGAQNARDRGISVGTLPAGVYALVANITAANRRSLGIRQSTNDHLASVGTSNEDMTTGVKSVNFVLNEETSDLYVNGANSGTVRTNQSEDFDYVIIKKLVSKTISSAGWATFCSPYALDLKNAEGLVDAYIVTGGKNGVLQKTSVKNGTVPANTGLLLKGTQGTATIPVAASSSTDVTSNILVGVTEETKIDANTGWVLMNDATNGLGFYKNNNDFTVGANTAYILISKLPELATGGARASYLLFDDMTGISQVAGSEVKTSGAVYNLNGQRVSQPVKGLYIIDGKKVVIK